MSTLEQQHEEIRARRANRQLSTAAAHAIDALLTYIDELIRDHNLKDIELANLRGEVASYANAHTVLMAERAVLNDTVFRLQKRIGELL